MANDTTTITKRTACRICGSVNLFPFLDLGSTPLVDAFVAREDLGKPEEQFPLEVGVCMDCNLVSLMHVVDSELLFGNNYAFYSSGSPQGVIHFQNYAKKIMERFPHLAKQLTVEIASNDGVLLRPMKELGANVLGIEPARNVAPVAEAAGIKTIVAFFTNDSAKEVAKKYGKAGLILANNVVAHVDDLHDFMKGVSSLLDPEGVFIFEVHYLPNLIFRNQFDNVYHEHRSFFALRPLMKLLESEGLKIFDVERVDTQGGSIRVFASHKKSSHAVEPVVAKMAEAELAMGLDKKETYLGLQHRVEYIKAELMDMLRELKSAGKKIVGYGAPAKGNTLLNYCGITTDLVDYIVDKTYFKHGKFTPGTHIPVFPVEKINEDGYPDYYLLLPWNYAAGFVRNEKEFMAKGGKFIIPIPVPHIL